MRLHQRVTLVRAFGAEPIVFRAVEREQRGQADFLLDLLFDAQQDWFRESGEIDGVSEVPANFSPWFTDQVLSVGPRPLRHLKTTLPQAGYL
jgi:hypothetical protein